MQRIMLVLITAGLITAGSLLAGCDNAPNKPPKPIAEVAA